MSVGLDDGNIKNVKDISEETVRTEIHCHGCNMYFVAELHMSLEGNHEITCPNCGHMHYRIVENGKVTDDRYRSSMQSFTASTSTATSSATQNYYGMSNPYCYDSWTSGYYCGTNCTA